MTRTPLTPDDARDFAAQDLDAAMRACEVDNAVLARWLLVDEKLVRDLRKGEKPLTLGRVYQLPPALREETLRRASARFSKVVPIGAATAEAQANVCVGRFGEMLGELASALRDGRIDAAEADALMPQVRKVRDALDALTARLDGVRAPREQAS